MRLLKRLFKGLGTLIEKHKAIRRLIILTMFPLWLYISLYLLLLTKKDLTYPIVQFYAVFTGVVGTSIGFYFVNRQSNEKHTSKSSLSQDIIDDTKDIIIDKISNEAEKPKKKSVEFSDIDVSEPRPE